jgi:cation diffusion facilitator CzcD-associated flavoprotein CzcO
MPRPQYVAVIGAGVSGVATAAHLRAAGINVVVFERAGVAGGVWYDFVTKRQVTRERLTFV